MNISLADGNKTGKEKKDTARQQLIRTRAEMLGHRLAGMNGIDLDYFPTFPDSVPRREQQAAALYLVDGDYAEFYQSSAGDGHLMIRLTERGRLTFEGGE